MLGKLLDNLPLGLLIFLCLTLGLAPFKPPHIWEKLNMLFRLQLTRPVDWFDLFFHGLPWLLLILKLSLRRQGPQ